MAAKDSWTIALIKSLGRATVTGFSSGGLVNGFIRTGSLGLWLLMLYIVSGWLVVYSFSAHQLNNAINDFNKNAQIELSRWQVRNIYLVWSPLQTRIKTIKANLDGALKDTRSLNNWDLELLDQQKYVWAAYDASFEKISAFAQIHGFKRDSIAVRLEFDIQKDTTKIAPPPEKEMQTLLAKPGMAALMETFSAARIEFNSVQLNLAVVAEQKIKVRQDKDSLIAELRTVESELSSILVVIHISLQNPNVLM